MTRGGVLNDPLGLAIAPNGDVLTMNGGNGNLVEVTPAGRATRRSLIANGAGDLFGLAITPSGHGIYLVDDAGSGATTNSLELLR